MPKPIAATLSQAVFEAQLQRSLNQCDLSSVAVLAGARRYQGKVRDNYTLGERRLIVVTDRISAFDVVLGTIPFKGQVLNQMAAYWFTETRHLVPNHLVAVVDPSASIVRTCRPVPVEFVMRGYLTGVTSTSAWRHYEQGARRYAGHVLPDGMKKNEPFKTPLLTPSTKAEAGGHDETLARDEILARGLLDEETFDRAAAMVGALFRFGQARAHERGLILVDTKYELGFTSDGELIVIDEIHTPDSSRYWYLDDYEARLAAGEEPRALDKEYVRRHYAARGYTGDGPPPPLPDDVRIEAARRYIEAYERITGQAFVADTSDPGPRLCANLAQFERYFTP